MKGEFGTRSRRGLRRDDAEELATLVFARIAADDERLGRFLALSGLDPRTLRSAAASEGFLPAILEHVAQDEALLVEIAGELNVEPATLGEAARQLYGNAED